MADRNWWNFGMDRWIDIPKFLNGPFFHGEDDTNGLFWSSPKLFFGHALFWSVLRRQFTEELLTLQTRREQNNQTDQAQGCGGLRSC